MKRDLRELRTHAEAELISAQGYQPFDQEKWLGDPPWSGPALEEWEAVHGHDARLKCYAEYGCQVIEAPWAQNTIELLDLFEAVLHANGENP